MQILNKLEKHFEFGVVDGRFEIGLSKSGVFLFMRYATDYEMELDKVRSKYGILEEDYTLVCVTKDEDNWRPYYSLSSFVDDFEETPTEAPSYIKVSLDELENWICHATMPNYELNEKRYNEFAMRLGVVQESQSIIYQDPVDHISFAHTVAYRKLRGVCLRYVKSLDNLGFEILTDSQITRILLDLPRSNKALLDYGVPACCCDDVFEVLMGTPREGPKVNGTIVPLKLSKRTDPNAGQAELLTGWDILRIFWVLASIPVCYIACQLLDLKWVFVFCAINAWIFLSFNVIQNDKIIKVCTGIAVVLNIAVVIATIKGIPLLNQF